jgi:hypothetical protein
MFHGKRRSATPLLLFRFSVGETLKAYKGCLLKLRQQQQLYIEEQDDQWPPSLLCRFSVGETLKAYKGCLLKLRQQQQLYIEEQDDQHLFEVEHGILDILGTYSSAGSFLFCFRSKRSVSSTLQYPTYPTVKIVRHPFFGKQCFSL